MSDATDNNALRILVQQLAGTFNKDLVSIVFCTVNSVNENEMTCDCTPITGDSTTSIPGVKLNADTNDGFLKLPTVGSTVGVITSTRNVYCVVLYSDIDKIVCVMDNNNSYEFSSSGFIWNNGTKGGLINITQQTTKLNALVAQLQTQLALISTAIVSLGGSYTPGTLTPLNQTDYEDTNIKH